MVSFSLFFYDLWLEKTNIGKLKLKYIKGGFIMRIALAGNPNSGKTTMYNALTGRNEKVGNWAGVTVEKKESPINRSYFDGKEELIAVDLPGVSCNEKIFGWGGTGCDRC